VLGKILEIQKDVHEAVKAEPKLQQPSNFHALTRDEKMAIWWRIINAANSHPVLGPKYFYNNSETFTTGMQWSYNFCGVSPVHLH
jgi:hypothetical protein